jgi:hypothetical protein
MRTDFIRGLSVWFIFLLLTFPAFYFVYKYGHPDFGLKDFHDYYKLYKNFDIKSVDAPFNMRLLSSFFVFLMYKLGFHYHTENVFDLLGMDKNVFFCAVLFNYICIVTTCTVIFYTIKQSNNNVLLSFIGAVLYLLGFGTLFYEMMPITDALSVLLFAWLFKLYIVKSRWILAPLVLLVFQREYIFLALGLIAFIDYLKDRERYYLRVVVYSSFLFAGYMILRKTFFYTPTYDYQASLGYFFDSVIKIKFPIIPYIKQTLMTLNIFLIYLGVITFKWIRSIPIIDKIGFYKIIALFIQINIISFAAVFGNNTGRYFYILVPMVIFYLIKESLTFIIDSERGE